MMENNFNERRSFSINFWDCGKLSNSFFVGKLERCNCKRFDIIETNEKYLFESIFLENGREIYKLAEVNLLAT